MKLTADASLVFQAWVEPMYYNPDGHVPENHPLYHRLEQLSDEDRWKAVELLDGLRSRHDFCVCRPDRPPRSYRIDFREPDFPDRAIPLPPDSTLTPASDGKPALLKGPRATPLTLPPPLAALYRQIDGQRTVRKCLEAAPVDAPAEVLKQHGLRFFRSLWRTGHVKLRLKETT